MEKILMLRRIKGKRRVLKKIRWVDSITDSVDMDLSNSRRQWRTEEPGMLQSMGSQSQTWLSD